MRGWRHVRPRRRDGRPHSRSRASIAASLLDELLLALAGKARPHVVFLPTATGGQRLGAERFRAASARVDCTRDVVETFGVPDRPGGARRRGRRRARRRAATPRTCSRSGALHGVDRALREAWERGGALGGVSAGANCWFEACVTDSFSAELDGLDDGLGFLAGSFCPHFDGEERRRPVYTRLVAEGFPAGIACDDGAAAHLPRSPSSSRSSPTGRALGYRVSSDGIEPLPTPRASREEGLRHRHDERQRQDDRRTRAGPPARRPLRRARRARARAELDRDAGRRAAAAARADRWRATAG